MSDFPSPPELGKIIARLSARVATLERESAAFPTYTLATRPAATDVKAGTAIFVSDGGAGARFQGSDGATWLSLG